MCLKDKEDEITKVIFSLAAQYQIMWQVIGGNLITVDGIEWPSSFSSSTTQWLAILRYIYSKVHTISHSTQRSKGAHEKKVRFTRGSRWRKVEEGRGNDFFNAKISSRNSSSLPTILHANNAPSQNVANPLRSSFAFLPTPPAAF